MKQKTSKRGLLIIALAICSISPSFGQNAFNHTYREAEGRSIKEPKGKSIILDDENCGNIVTVNSISNPSGFFNFQLSIIDNANGGTINSFTIGSDLGSDYCNGLSRSLTDPNQYVLCGKSANNNMLVMEVDNSGGIVWAKEIFFGINNSEAINVLPIEEDQGGYLIVGTAGVEIAVAKLDLTGDVLFSNQYLMSTPYTINTVTDAVLMQEISSSGIREACVITGTQIDFSSGSAHPERLFTVQIDVLTGDPLWNQSIYQIINQQGNSTGYGRIYNPQIVTTSEFPNIGNGNGNTFEIDNFLVSFAQSTGQLHRIELTSVFKANPRLGNPWWNYSFYGGPQDLTSTMTTDMIRLNKDDGEFVILSEEHLGPGVYNPFILQIDKDGNFISETSYDVVNRNITPFSIAENCEEQLIHNGSKRETSAPHPEYAKVIRTDQNFNAPCSDQFFWESFTPEMTETHTVLTTEEYMDIDDYEVYAELVDNVIFDCEEQELAFNRLKSPSSRGESSITPSWFFPNPVSSQLQLQLADEKETINIYNKLGQNVLTKQLSGSVSLDISELPVGVYFIERINSLEEVSGERLIIY